MLTTGSDWQLRPRRSLDLGDVLLTIGERGVVSWDAATYEVRDAVRFDPPSFEEEFHEPRPDAPGRGDPGFDDAG